MVNKKPLWSNICRGFLCFKINEKEYSNGQKKGKKRLLRFVRE